MAISDYLNKLVELKNDLITTLRNKGVEVSDDEKLNTLVPKVNEVETGIDTSDATATAEDMAEGVTAYVNNEKITGVLPRWSGIEWKSPSLIFQQEEGRLRAYGSTSAKRIVNKGSGNVSMYIAKDRLGNATADDVAKGKTFTSAEGLMVTGTAETVEQNVEWVDNVSSELSVEDQHYLTNIHSFCKKIILPYGITIIPETCFYKSTNLEIIVIPKSVTTIEQQAFGFCTALKNIIIPEGVVNLGEDNIYRGGAFQSCTNLENIVISSTVTLIGYYCFRDCSSLANIYYTGTEEQWNAITKVSGWNYNMGSNVTGGTVIHYNYIPE